MTAKFAYARYLRRRFLSALLAVSLGLTITVVWAAWITVTDSSELTYWSVYGQLDHRYVWGLIAIWSALELGIAVAVAAALDWSAFAKQVSQIDEASWNSSEVQNATIMSCLRRFSRRRNDGR